MSEHVLELQNLTMQFGGVVAVDDLSMYVDKGEIIALIGPNGAGKTTAFNMITGVYAPTNGADFLQRRADHLQPPAGEYEKALSGQQCRQVPECDGKAPRRDHKAGHRRTFQNIRLFKDLTVFENVLIAKHMRSKAGVFAATFRLNAKEERAMRAETMRLLEILELADLRNETASNLPYGKQRPPGDRPAR